MSRSFLFLLYLGGSVLPAAGQSPASAPEASAAHFPSIQAAVDAHPGKVVWVPAGDHVITEKIRLRTDGAGLMGPGRIIQTNAEAPVLEIFEARNVRVQDLTLLRPEGRQETRAEAVVAVRCRDLWLDRLRVFDNRSSSASIAVRESQGVRVSDCLVRNYMRVAVDDRTASKGYGYAFKCIDGTGIGVSYCSSVLIEGNRVVEDSLLPTPEVQKAHDLGRFVKKNPVKGSIISQKTWDDERVDNWHQGSAIIVTAPEVSDAIRLIGNSIENAAQGIDIHADHVIVQGNIINNAFIGMKAMHGSRNVLISGNQFIRNDLWSIGLMPGAAAHPARPAADGQPAAPANADGGSIIANNIISDFGHGHAHWIWGGQGNPIRFDSGQEPDDPPLTRVLVQGNVVYEAGVDPAPRFKHTVRVPADLREVHFANNLFPAGSEGVSNHPLPQ